MKENIQNAGRFYLFWEGAFSDDPNDPGGLTIYGVSKRSHPDVIAVMLPLWEAGNKEACKRISIELFKRKYWNPIDGDNLPEKLDIAAADCAFNQGVGRAREILAITKDWMEFIIRRYDYYDDLNGFKQFGKGWSKRMVSLFDFLKSDYTVLKWD